MSSLYCLKSSVSTSHFSERELQHYSSLISGAGFCKIQLQTLKVQCHIFRFLFFRSVLVLIKQRTFQQALIQNRKSLTTACNSLKVFPVGRRGIKALINGLQGRQKYKEKTVIWINEELMKLVNFKIVGKLNKRIQVNMLSRDRRIRIQHRTCKIAI